MTWRTLWTALLAGILAGVVLGLVFLPGIKAGAATDCPLAKQFDFNCSLTLSRSVMHHAAPEPVASHLDNAIASQEGKIKNRAQELLSRAQYRQSLRKTIAYGKKVIDGKNASDAGRVLRDRFRKVLSWVQLDKKSHRVGTACGVAGAAAFALKRYYDHESMSSSEHAAIEACWVTAWTTAVLG